MSLKSIKAALEAHLLTISSPLLTEWENVPFTLPNATEAYQRVNFIPATPENPSLGTQMYREIGIMQISLFYPILNGAGPAYAKAEALRDWFPRGSTYSRDGVNVTIQRTPAIIPARRDNDRFFVGVRVTYFANIVLP